MNIMPTPEKNYTVIQNDIFNNYPNMSSKSKFMLLQLLSKQGNWNLNMKWLAAQNSEGFHAVRSAVQEWEENDFLHRFTIRTDGRIKGVESVICYPPISRDQAEVKFQEAYPDVKQTSLPESTTSAKVKTSDIDISKDTTCNQVIRHQETTPLINTDSKQILRGITTTTPEPESKPETVTPQEKPSIRIRERELPLGNYNSVTHRQVPTWPVSLPGEGVRVFCAFREYYV